MEKVKKFNNVKVKFRSWFNKNYNMASLSYQAVIIVLHPISFVLSEEFTKKQAEEINKKCPYNIKYIFPQAPIIKVHYFNKEKMSSWYDIISKEDLENGENDHGLIHNISQIDNLIEKEIKKGISSQNILITGLSQGGSVGLSMAMISRHELGGFASLSAFLPYHKALKKVETEKNRQTPIFMGYGEKDEIISYEESQKSLQILLQSDYKTKLKNYPNEPHFSSLIIDDGIDFCAEIFRSRNLLVGNFDPENVEIVKIRANNRNSSKQNIP